MSHELTRAQLVMLAQTLHVPEGRLAHLARLGADNLRLLRERISNVLFDEHTDMFKRVGGLAPLLPSALIAKVAEAAIPPLVGGRAGGALGVDHPDKAVGVLSKLSPGYMADAAPYLDPRTLKVLAPQMPPGPLIPAAQELLRRRDYITAARFIEFATPELIRAFERALDDDEGVLQVAAFTHADEQLSAIVRLLPPERICSIVTTAVRGREQLQTAALSLLARIDSGLQAHVGEALRDGLDTEVLSDLRGLIQQRAEALDMADAIVPLTDALGGD